MAEPIAEAVAQTVAISVAGPVSFALPATSARGFDGTTQRLEIADQASLSPGDAVFWVFAMVKMNDVSGTQIIIGKYTSTADQREYALYANGTTLSFTTSGNGTNAPPSAQAVERASGIGAGDWKGFLGYHDSVANQIGVWYEGTETTLANSQGVFQGTGPFTIGSTGTPHSWSNAHIANCAFGVAPTMSMEDIYDVCRNNEAGRLYSSLSASQKTAMGLVSWWDNQESGITDNAADSHGSNTLTQSGSPSIETGPG